MEQSSSPFEPGARVRATFGRFRDQVGTVVESASGLPEVFDGPVMWVRFDGEEEPGLVAGQFLEQAA
ncbi:KOW motif-containing protein [Saccharopolyspora sp. HNM0983]|uniref:KOW motif-containing protein n=1 Tax=Saccharopolyspora montiporae TaxID=2781240 RepID=A0A929B7U7_9PSEU|nr:KOW motif-containing protein [Saccharopolyspora sp. HNM0983]MBE9374824.1 KOW motif-containing protein [Saccharopolyspora sp. HNM0983]